MGPFISLLKTNKLHCINVGGALLACGSFWLWDNSQSALTDLQWTQGSQTQVLSQWQHYQEAHHQTTPLFTLFEQHQKAPDWTRAKIKQAFELLTEQYDLELREFLVMETRQDQQDLKTAKSHRLRLTIRATHDQDLLVFIHHLRDKVRPWIKISDVTLQRCGSIDESVLQEVKNGQRIDMIEARFELEWLLSLDGNDNTVDR